MLKDNSYLKDILESAKVICDHTLGMSRDQFLADIKTQDAVYRRFEIMGEAARHLSPTARQSLSDIPWALITGMRNVLIHDYDDVDPKRVWETAQKDLLSLISRLEDYFSNQPSL